MQRIYTQPFVVVRAFIEREKKILLVQENWGHVKGLWNFPAGWLDLGESPIDGAIREVKEETGYKFTPDFLVGVYSFTKDEGDIHAHPLEFVYAGRIFGEPTKVDKAEISQMKWFTPEEIYKMDASTLRDGISKRELKDYLSGKNYPLEAVIHQG